MIQCIEHDPEIAAFYASETAAASSNRPRAVACCHSVPQRERRSLSWRGDLVDLVPCTVRGRLRTVLTTVLVRKLKADRMYASQIKRRLALNSDSPRCAKALS